MVQVVINPPRTPLGKVDGKPVEIDPIWYRFFVSIQKLLGGDSGGSDPFDDAILVATSAAVAAADRNEDDFLGFHRTPGILTASAGLTGGGDMEGNISVSVGAGTGLTVNANDVAITATGVVAGAYGSASQVGTFTVNAQGQLTAAANVTITPAAIGGVPDTRTLTAGAGLTGGGDLTSDRTFDVGAGTGITVNANDVALDTASTRNTDHAGVTLTAGAGLTGGGDISASRTFDVGAGTGITVNANDVALDTASTRNTDHSGVTLTAGAGLTGGGDISASRSFAVGAGTGITVNADSVEVDTTVVVTLTGSQTLTNKTLTAAILGGTTDVSGGQLKFPASQSASADANTLDDYEEGTWTPTITAGSGTFTTVSGTGYYTKIGRHVLCNVVIDITTNGTAATNVIFSLPFTAGTSGGWAGCGRETFVTGNMLQVFMGSGATTAAVYTYNNAYPGGSGYQIVVNVSYFV